MGKQGMEKSTGRVNRAVFAVIMYNRKGKRHLF
jgi:hypothetical protein